jgi:hypothetical protein
MTKKVKTETVHEIIGIVQNLDWESFSEKNCQQVLRHRRVLELALTMMMTGDLKVDNLEMAIRTKDGSLRLIPYG